MNWPQQRKQQRVCRERSLLQSQRKHRTAWQCPSSVPGCCSPALPETNPAGTTRDSNKLHLHHFILTQLPAIAMAAHVHCVWAQMFSAASWWFYTTQVNMRPHTWKKNCQSYINLDKISRHKELNSLQPHQRNPTEFGQRNVWKEQKIQASLGICLYPQFQGTKARVHQQWAQTKWAGLCHPI